MSRLRLVLIKLGFHFGRKARESIIHERPDLILRRERYSFVEEPYWKTHRIVDAELDKLEIALDVNDNGKSEDGKDEQVFYKVVISISCDLFQYKTHPYTISFSPCSGKFYYCFLLLVIVFPLFSFYIIFHRIVVWL